MSIPPPPPRRRAPGATPSPPPIDPAAREARRAEEGMPPEDTPPGRRRTILIVAALVVVAVVGAGLVVALGGGKDTPELTASTSVNLELGDVTVESVSPFDANEKFPKDDSDAALAALEAYVHEGTVTSLRKGTASDTALAEVFDAPAVTRLAGTDRGLLLDEGRPRAVGKVTVKGPPVALTGLLDTERTIVLIVATIDLDIKAQARTGTMTATRTGTLVLGKQGDGSWKITAWTLHVERAGPGVSPSPTDPTTTTVAT